MTQKPEGLPITTNKAGESVIETRPLYIEEWLESLPYMNFLQTSELINTAIRATNDVAMKSSKRVELIGLYDSAYRYMLENEIRVGEKHSLQTVESEHSSLSSLKKIAATQARACRIAMEETFHQQNTSWLKTKPPLEAALSALNYLSYALLFSYMEYLPTPKNVWRELNYLYKFSVDLKKQDQKIKEITEAKDKRETSIEDAYKRIILTSMIDYHHLPFGAIWEVFQQLESMTALSSIEPYQETDSDNGLFVIDIENDVKPVSLARFNKQLAQGRNLYLLNARDIHSKFSAELINLDKRNTLSSEFTIAPQYARNVLIQIVRYWGNAPRRYAARTESQGSVELALGLNNAHYYLSGQHEFDLHNKPAEDDDSIDVMQGVEEERVIHHESIEWQLVNQSSGGMALSLEKKPSQTLKVGDLLAVKSPDPGDSGRWFLATVRWLLIHYNQSYLTGIEILSKKARAIGVRPKDHSDFIRGFAFNMDKSTGNFWIITSRGVFQAQHTLEVRLAEQSSMMTMTQLKESNGLFEYFEVSPA